MTSSTQLNPWQMLEVLPGNIFWMDRRGVYQGCNFNVAKLLKLATPKDIIGKSNLDLLPPEICEYIDKNNEQVMQGKLTLVVEEPGIDLDWQPAIYLSHKIPILDEKGNVQGLLGIALDITEKKQLEESLREAKEQADMANHAKSEFIGNMSHDLRTPLSGMVGMAEVIQHHTKEPSTKEYATMMVGAGTQLSKFVDRILEHCQLEHPKTVSKVVSFDLKKIVDAISDLMQPVVITKQLNFQVDYDASIPSSLLGDRDYCFQIILNLVSNAVKFTERGNVNLRLYLTKHAAESIELQIIVQDTGIGIAKAQHEVIFESFSRLSPSCQQKFDGVGLGLFLVRQYVQRMNGSIALESDIGQGATFICTLPFKLPKSA